MRSASRLALAVVLVAAPAWAQGRTYKLGFINHLTGDAAVYGQSMKKGTEIALEEVNGAGGVKGTKLEVVFEDDRLSAADAQTAFLKLVQSDKVPVVMGSGSSTLTLSLCPKSRESKVVLISSISTAPSLRNCGPYFFGAMASDDAAGVAWANMAFKKGYKEAAVVYINNDYGLGVKNAFVKDYTARGGKVLVEQGFDVGTSEFRTELLTVRAKSPKAIFLVSHLKEGALLLKQAVEIGLKAQWIADTAMQAQEVIDLAGAGAEGLIALSAGNKSTAAYRNFAERFRKKFNEEPTIWADFAYDTTMLVSKAVEKGGYSADGIQKALKQVGVSYTGPSGPKKFNQHNIVVEYYESYQVRGDKWVPAD